jgi:hypothetical protein
VMKKRDVRVGASCTMVVRSGGGWWRALGLGQK